MTKQVFAEKLCNPKCCRGIRHEYDIVEGPMADDTIWDYVEDYAAERISKAAFWELVRM